MPRTTSRTQQSNSFLRQRRAPTSKRPLSTRQPKHRLPRASKDSSSNIISNTQATHRQANTTDTSMQRRHFTITQPRATQLNIIHTHYRHRLQLQEATSPLTNTPRNQPNKARPPANRPTSTQRRNRAITNNPTTSHIPLRRGLFRSQARFQEPNAAKTLQQLHIPHIKQVYQT